MNPINHEILMHAAKLKADHGRSSCDPRAYDLAVALLDAVEKIGEMKRLARQSSDSLADGLVTAADEAEEQRKRADRLETEIAQLRRRVVARTPEELLEQLHGAVTTTRNEAGEIVAITRTDDEGRILFVIWERDPEPPAAGTPNTREAVAPPTPERNGGDSSGSAAKPSREQSPKGGG